MILQGELFEAYLDDKGELTVSKDNYIPCTFNYSSPNYREDRNYDPSYYPEIINFEYIEEYLQQIENWVDTINMNFIRDLTTRI